jgi:DNA mismatch repair protein MutL
VLAGGSRFPSPPPPAGGSRGLAEQAVLWQAPLAPAGRPPAFEPASGPPPESSSAAVEPPPADFPLGVARAQLHQTYILAESAGGLVIVDQHAAHERLTQERLKAALIEGGPVPRQGLLIPEVVELGAAGAGRLLARGEELAALGLGLESFGPGAVLVREVPALLGQADVQGLVRDLADQLAELDQATALRERLDAVCATLACHGSIRAGRTLAPAEMNALLRQIEATPHAGQCSHGRPTWVELKRADLERLFGRR